MATPENILTSLLSPPGEAEPQQTATEASPATEAEPTQPAPAATPEPDEPAPPEPVLLADLARQLDLKPDDFFAAVNSNGVSAKDAFAAAKEHRDIDAERIELERKHNTLRVEKAQAHKEISDYIALLPAGAIDPGITEKLADVRKVATEQNQAALLVMIPEWSDPSVKQTDVDAMVKMVAQFGAMPADLGGIVPPWQLNMIRHFARLETRINNYLAANAEKPKPKGVKRGGGKPDSARSSETVDIGAMVKSAKGAR